MVMTETQQVNKASEVAEEIGMTYERFLFRCMAKGLSVDTARAVWNKAERDRERGFFKTTKNIVADILHKPVDEVFPA